MAKFDVAKTSVPGLLTISPKPIHDDRGWTPERLAELFPGTLRHHLAPLETSGQFFNYDPLV